MCYMMKIYSIGTLCLENVVNTNLAVQQGWYIHPILETQSTLTESYIRENCTRLHWKVMQNHTKIDHVINCILVKQPFQKEIVFVISDDYSNDIHHVYLTDPQRKMCNDVRILKDLLGSANCVLNYIHLPYFCGTSITFKGLLIILDMSLVTIWIFYMDSLRRIPRVETIPSGKKYHQALSATRPAAAVIHLHNRGLATNGEVYFYIFFFCNKTNRIF